MSFATARVAPEKAVFRPVLPLAPMPGMTEMHVKKTYFEKLKDPRWQKKRLEALEAAGWRCAMCMDGESTLHVHHKQYFKGREPWEYDIDQLEVLCEDCHAAHHDSTDGLQLAASYVPINGPVDRDQAAHLLRGLIFKPLADEAAEVGYAQIAHFVGRVSYWLLCMDLNSQELVDKLPGIADHEAATVMARAFREHYGMPVRPAPSIEPGEF